MKLQELNIPGLDRRNAEERQVNVDAGWDGRVVVCLPVFSYHYSDTAGDLKSQTELLRGQFEEVKRFFLENSYGRFSIDFALKSATLRKPRDWKGNLEGIVPRYHPENHPRKHELSNPEDFLPLEAYTGYEPVRIYRWNPDEVDVTKDDYFRSYESQTRRNIMQDVIAAAREKSNDWDDNKFGVDEIMLWALKPGKLGHAVFASSAIGRSVVRGDFAALPVGNNRHIHRLALNGVGDAIVHAHELGHLLLGLGDHYISGVRDGRRVRVTRNGFLGEASVMGTAHLRGDDAHLDAVSKFRMGWLDATVVEPTFASRDFALAPVYADARNVLLVRPNKHLRPGEFFLLEHRTRDGRDGDGRAIEFDRHLDDELDGGVVVYHVDATDPYGGDLASAEPFVDVEGEEAGTVPVVAMHEGERLDEEAMAFHGRHRNGLSLAFEGRDAAGAQIVTVTWTLQPKLDVTTTPDDTVHLVGRSDTGVPMYRILSSIGPVARRWESLGGACVGRPSVTPIGDGLLVQVRGVSERPFVKRFENGAWSPGDMRWRRLPGKITAEPEALEHADHVHLVARGVSGRAFFRHLDGDWIPVNDTPIEGRPTLAALRDHGVQVFARGEDGRALHCPLGDGEVDDVRSWTDLGGRISSDVCAVSDHAAETVHVFARGISGRLFHKWYDGHSWQPGASRWEDLGGQGMGGASAACTPDGSVHLLVTGISARPFHKHFDGTRWTDWNSLGGQVIDTPVVTARRRDEARIDVFATGISGQAFHKWWDGGAWQPGQHEWSPIGEAFL